MEKNQIKNYINSIIEVEIQDASSCLEVGLLVAFLEPSVAAGAFLAFVVEPCEIEIFE